jgi:hypothetical protein
MNLYQKLVQIRKDVVEFSKDKDSYKYKYVSGSQAIRKIREKMDELEILLVPNMGETESHTYDYKTYDREGKEKDNTDYVVTGNMSYTWINAENPEETLTIPWKLYGEQDDISKAFGSGLTYSERYFILKFFQAPTDSEDPDARDTSGRSRGATGKSTTTGLSEAQIKRLYAIAYSKGVERKAVDSLTFKKFKKKIEALTKEEYDFMCNGYEKMV